MGSHITKDGEFQSDKYPTCPAGKVPLSTKDPMAQDLLWEYARRREAVDLDFSHDLRAALIAKGVDPQARTLHDERIHAGEMQLTITSQVRALSNLRDAMESTLRELRQVYENLTAAQTAGTNAVKALQHLRGNVRILVNGAAPVTMFDSLSLKRAIEVSERLECGKDIEEKTR